MIRLALTQPDADEVTAVLLDAAPKEAGCFMLLREVCGQRGRRLIASDPIFAEAGDFEVSEAHQLRPSATWISAAISRAVIAKAGLLFIHSHPDERHPATLSQIDICSVTSLAETIGPILEGPFGAAVVTFNSWTAVVADNATLTPVDRITSIGRTLRDLTFADPRSIAKVDDYDLRQADALGNVHRLVRELDVAVVGVGGLGSPIAEQLVRMGVANLTIIDDDVLDTPSNLRRLFGSTKADLRSTVAPPKVDVVGRHLEMLDLGVAINRVKGDVRDPDVLRHAVDADVIFCATDTHGSRAVLNDLAYTCLLPVIDVGVQAGAMRNGVLAALTAEVRILTATTPCLWCRETISADRIRAENLPPEQRDRLVDEGYLVGGVGEPAPSVVALTVLGASLATCALLAMLTPEGDVCPPGYVIDGLMGDGIETEPHEPNPTCRCRTTLALGLRDN